jgi:hypothetical protein
MVESLYASHHSNCAVVGCNYLCVVLCCAYRCDKWCAVLCCAVLCCAVLCCAVLCCAVLCCAVLCCAVLCYAPRAPVGSIEDVEAQMRSAAAAADPTRILPKSMRKQLQEAAAAEAAEQELMQEMAVSHVTSQQHTASVTRNKLLLGQCLCLGPVTALWHVCWCV